MIKTYLKKAVHVFAGFASRHECLKKCILLCLRPFPRLKERLTFVVRCTPQPAALTYEGLSPRAKAIYHLLREAKGN